MERSAEDSVRLGYVSVPAWRAGSHDAGWQETGICHCSTQAERVYIESVHSYLRLCNTPSFWPSGGRHKAG